MQPELIFPVLGHRLARQGLKVEDYEITYEDIWIPASPDPFRQPSYEALLVLVNSPRLLRIRSDLGAYNYGDGWNTHIHEGQVLIWNLDTEAQLAQFVRLLQK